jgi:hypothetical protein
MQGDGCRLMGWMHLWGISTTAGSSISSSAATHKMSLPPAALPHWGRRPGLCQTWAPAASGRSQTWRVGTRSGRHIERLPWSSPLTRSEQVVQTVRGCEGVGGWVRVDDGQTAAQARRMQQRLAGCDREPGRLPLKQTWLGHWGTGALGHWGTGAVPSSKANTPQARAAASATAATSLPHTKHRPEPAGPAGPGGQPHSPGSQRSQHPGGGQT